MQLAKITALNLLTLHSNLFSFIHASTLSMAPMRAVRSNGEESLLLGRSLKYNMKNNGPNTDP